jgi:amyloid beta precursor protein binding protein 1
MLDLMFGSDYRELKTDVSMLKAIIVSILNDMGGGGATLFVDMINEVCHFGASESHILVSIVCGISSQKVIKVNSKYNYELFQC